MLILCNHLNYEQAKHTLAAEIVIALNQQDRWWDRYGIETCKDPKHHDCFNIYDVNNLRSQTGGLSFPLDSTATQRTSSGALLWLHGPRHQGWLTNIPS